MLEMLVDGKDLQDASGMQNPGYANMGGREAAAALQK